MRLPTELVGLLKQALPNKDLTCIEINSLGTWSVIIVSIVYSMAFYQVINPQDFQDTFPVYYILLETKVYLPHFFFLMTPTLHVC